MINNNNFRLLDSHSELCTIREANYNNLLFLGSLFITFGGNTYIRFNSLCEYEYNKELPICNKASVNQSSQFYPSTRVKL